MILTCQYCHKPFEWERPASRRGGMPPLICGAYDEHDRWQATEACRVKRARIQSVKNKAKKKANPMWYKKSKNIPKSKVKRRCVYMVLKEDGTKKRCNRVTGSGGHNRLYCDYHHAFLTNEIAGDAFIFIDGGENLAGQFAESAR